jgi:transcriptional regulator with GAF, ATPase, and Fis domain
MIDFRAAKARSIAEFERGYLVQLLERTNGNLTLAARMSGKDRSRLGKLIRKYGLTRSQFAQL